MPASSTTAAARRIFHITDWAPAHEALYPGAENDSSIDTLSFPTKPGETSSCVPASVAASASASSSASAATSAFASASATSPCHASSSVVSTVRRSSTKKDRSMSVPWRAKSLAIPVVRPAGGEADDGDGDGDVDQRLRDLSLQRSRTIADAADSSASPMSSGFENWSGFGAGPEHEFEQEREREQGHESNMGKGKGKKSSISGIWRRASVQIKTLVHRRTSIATETLDESRDLEPQSHLPLHMHNHSHHLDHKRQLRSSHAPSRSHHILLPAQNGPASASSTFLPTTLPLPLPLPLPAPSPSPSPSHSTSPSVSPSASPSAGPSPSSPAAASSSSAVSPRSIHSQSINARWHRLRKATSTSFRHSRILHGDFALSSPHIPTEDLPHSVPRPGIGNEPPIIPRNSGSGARAAVAAWQNEMFPLPFKNKRLTLDSAHNDRESGIGIAVTSASTDSVADELQDTDILAASVEAVLGACGPSRVDFVYRLPVELAIQVLAHLDAASLAPASRVSKAWRAVTSLQHIWRESYLREKTGTYASSEPIRPGVGLGVPAIQPNMNWKDAYAATEELAKRWKQGKATSVWMNGHSDSIYCLQFDEQKIITGSRDKTIRIWDMHTKACKLVIGPPEVVNNQALLYNADGVPTHTTSFEPHTGAHQRRTTAVPTTVAFQTHHKASILCLQYDEDILVTGSSDATCIIYDIKGGYKPIRRLQHHTAAVLDLCFDEKHIVTCSKDISICVWDRATGTLLKQLRGHSGPVNAVQMRGNTIVSCSGDFRVKLWNIETGKQIREFQGHTKGLACSQFSEDGRYIASAGNDKVIRIWDAHTGECLREMKAHDSLVRSLHIDSVSGRLVSGSYDTDIKVFDMETGRQMLDFPRWHSSWVLSAKSDYRRIVSTGQDPKILVIDFGAGVDGIEMLESPAGGRALMEDVAQEAIEGGEGFL